MFVCMYAAKNTYMYMHARTPTHPRTHTHTHTQVRNTEISREPQREQHSADHNTPNLPV